ncbi:glucoside xylosyltransferase 1 isoform X4 [Peromyscus maniculatus bairdii]|uniref:Glucoside xylosyltransferase 1 n=1 Tax=Peromyscus maniculatus bairdii TaxID=230844 RepID=A0A6I9L7L7_PERMB|nr:glucoside xylosyltransferase 1 isoform X1 [Peromyscus maniculatus bairdii]
MRRYLRVVGLCLACGFCSLLYAFSQLAVSLEEGAAGGRRPQAAAMVSWLADGERGGPGRGAGSAGSGRPGRCKGSSLCYWNPYWMLPSAVCGMNCFWEAAFRYSLKTQPTEKMHLAVVACGERLEETLTMLKSALIFSIKPLQVHIFAEDQLHDSFKDRLDSWSFLQRFNYTLYPITFPSDSAVEWKKLFKPCASQRLFLPLILKEVDSLLYVDTDILFLRPVDDIWSLLKKFNSTQIAAMAPEHEEPRIGWYNRFARHPYYGKTGVNSGVMLMNLTRMRRKYFKNDMTTARLQWGDILMPLLKKYKLNITWGDQDLLNIMFFHNPESLFVFPCQWNYRPDHCIYGSNCRGAEEEGVFILHGNRGVYHDDKQPAFRAVYEALRNCSFEDDAVRSLLKPLELELQKTVHTYCGKTYKVFIKQLTKSIRNRYDTPPKER